MAMAYCSFLYFVTGLRLLYIFIKRKMHLVVTELSPLLNMFFSGLSTVIVKPYICCYLYNNQVVVVVMVNNNNCPRVCGQSSKRPLTPKSYILQQPTRKTQNLGPHQQAEKRECRNLKLKHCAAEHRLTPPHRYRVRFAQPPGSGGGGTLHCISFSHRILVK